MLRALIFFCTWDLTGDGDGSDEGLLGNSGYLDQRLVISEVHGPIHVSVTNFELS